MVKQELAFKITFLIAIILIFSLVIFSVLLSNNNSELKRGKPAQTFCSKICGDNEVLSSNNNTEYHFIRCECLLNSQIDASPYSGAKTKITTATYYFNSVSFKNITEKELMETIQNQS